MSADQRGSLEISVRATFDRFEIDVHQEIPGTGVTGLFGPSGSGKSTLVRVIAGLETAATGRILRGDEIWLDSERGIHIPTHRRPVGYVFQNARLFPHLDVRGNLEFAARRNPSSGDDGMLESIVDSFDLGDLLHRDVSALSGGETQRIAIARTLLVGPELLLLDEPLSALDAGRKAGILPYLDTLSSEFNVPVIYVSHSVDEILRLADRVVVMRAGRAMAEGPAVQVMNEVAGSEHGLAGSTGTVMEAVVAEHQAHDALTRLDFFGQALLVPFAPHVEPGKPIRLYARAEDVALATRLPEATSFRNILKGTISSIQRHDGDGLAVVFIDVGGAELRSRVTIHAVEDLTLTPGTDVYALLKAASLDHRAPPLG